MDLVVLLIAMMPCSIAAGIAQLAVAQDFPPIDWFAPENLDFCQNKINENTVGDLFNYDD